MRQARKAVELMGKEEKVKDGRLRLWLAGAWATLGTAHYRAGEHRAAVAALEKAVSLNPGGDAVDHFFLAMAHWRLGEEARARRWYRRGVAWLKVNEGEAAKHKQLAEELNSFRAEAAGLLGVKEGVTPGGKDR